MASDQAAADHPGSDATGINNNEGNQVSGAGAVVQAPPSRPAIYETRATLPDDVTVTVTKGRTLFDALGRINMLTTTSTTLLVISLKVDPKLLPASHPDFDKEGLKPRRATMFVDYMSIERIKAITHAKTRPLPGGRGQQPHRLCFKCLVYSPVSTNPECRKIDLTEWNRSNPLRHLMEWHPLRMIMHATIPVEVTWHKSCLNEPGKTLSKAREDWLDSTPGSLFRILSAEEGTTFAGDSAIPKIKLSGQLPPPVTTNRGRSFDYAGFVTELWDAGVEEDAEEETGGESQEVDAAMEVDGEGVVSHDGEDGGVKKEDEEEEKKKSE